MASSLTSPKTIAIIMDTNVPHPMGPISLGIVEIARDTYLRPNVPGEYGIVVLDLEDHNLPQIDVVSGNIASSEQADQALTQWQKEISKHSGFVFLFPFYPWSYCNPIKNSICILPPEIWKRKPVMVMGYGKIDEQWDPVKNELRTMKKKSLSMMKGFMESKEMRMAKTDPMPEFPVYQDYWECWEKGGLNFHGGQQTELWESTAWNRCQEGVMWMVEDIERSAKKK
ncbi:hypothetical protein BP6252_07278 [Coleophoma cylindrospora]|uniref:NADPH-dependent FMN reductase-like domain-containing protein n=1 Tax=Coleophoma cylindrospora TaxID=1849047 RepID=A0A3D8RHQ1_9HELO|nr:hypothetical protein BP6252_07278 [Coleophoma cylindrospora]